MHLVYVFADESCLGNQYVDRASPGGAAGVVETWKRDRWIRRDFWASEPATTNNRMALRSAIEPLHALSEPCQVVFVSDSQYLIKGMSQWVDSWIRRGWKRAGGPVENVDLWQELVRTAARHIVEWRWIRGHAGHAMNEYANWRAIRAAKEQSQSNGLVASEFQAWLAQERAHSRHTDFDDAEAPHGPIHAARISRD